MSTNFDTMYAHYDIDGGWAWMVMFASFIGCFITSGVCFSNGVYYNEYITMYPDQKLLIALLTGLPPALFLLMGPVSIFTSRKFGYHLTIAVGAFLGSAGFGLSYLTSQIPILCITHGFLVGTGCGLIYSPVVCVLKLCFVQRYVLANAFGLSGVAFGSLIFPFLYHSFIQNFGLRGSLLLNAGVFLHTFLLAATLGNHSGSVRSKERKEDKMLKKDKTTVDLDHLTNGNIGVGQCDGTAHKISEGSSNSSTNTDESLFETTSVEYVAFPPSIAVSDLKIAYCSPQTILFMAYAFFEQCSCLIITLMIPKFAQSWGTSINSFKAGTLVSWIGIGELGGSLAVVVWGYHHARRSKSHSSPYTGCIFLWALLVQGWISAAFLIGFSKLYIYFCVMVFLFGFFYALRISLLNCLMIDLYGGERFATIYSWYFLFSGSGAIISIPSATWLAVAVKTPFAMFYITTTTFAICAVILSLVMYRVYYAKLTNHWENKKKERNLKILAVEFEERRCV